MAAEERVSGCVTAMDELAVTARPGVLQISGDGSMRGRSSRYQKRLEDLSGVYRDRDAFRELLADRGPATLCYTVEENRAGDGPGALIVGTSTLLPGVVGREFAMTRGHLHAVADRAELYHCLSGSGVLLLETTDGEGQAVPMEPGDAVHVPGHWLHRSINVGDQPFVTLFCYAADAGQNYDIIAAAGGMASLILSDGSGGWVRRVNPDHRGYSRS